MRLESANEVTHEALGSLRVGTGKRIGARGWELSTHSPPLPPPPGGEGLQTGL